MSNELDGKYIKNSSIDISKLSSFTLNDVASPISSFDFNAQDLINVKNLRVQDSDSSTIEDLNLGIINIKGAGSTIDHFTSLSFSSNYGSGNPLAKIGSKITNTGSELHLAISTNYATGINITMQKIDSSGITLKGGIFFDVNNTYNLGSASIAPSNIYSVNALNITSDNNEKKDINKIFPLGLNFALDVAKNAIASYKWKNTIEKEKKINNFKRIEKINEITNESIIDYELEQKIIPEKIIKHTRNHLGFLGVELFEAIKQHGFDTNQIGFLSIDNEDGKNFDKKGNPIIENNRPKGKITIKTGEMMPILFNAIFELNKIVNDLKKEIEILKEK